MKLAGPGTRLLPALSQWAPAAGRVLPGGLQQGPREGEGEAKPEEEGGLAGEMQSAAAGIEGDRGHCQIPIKMRERRVRLEKKGGWGGGRVLCARINPVPEAFGSWVRIFADNPGCLETELESPPFPHPCVCVFSPPVPTSWVSSARGHFEPQMCTITREENPALFALEARL